MPEERQMPRYKSHKTVWALEIKDITDFRLHFVDEGFASIEIDPKMTARYTPVPGDFYVQYEDGYISFSPRKAFLDGYIKVN